MDYVREIYTEGDPHIFLGRVRSLSLDDSFNRRVAEILNRRSSDLSEIVDEEVIDNNYEWPDIISFAGDEEYTSWFNLFDNDYDDGFAVSALSWPDISPPIIDENPVGETYRRGVPVSDEVNKLIDKLSLSDEELFKELFPDFYRRKIEEVERIIEGALSLDGLSDGGLISHLKPVISRQALNKASYIGRLLSEIYNPAPEVHFRVLGDGPENNFGADVIISHNQSVTPTSCIVSSSGFANDARLGPIYGWSHSHANMPPFHSGTDRANLDRMCRFYGRASSLSFESPDGKTKFSTSLWVMPSFVVNNDNSPPSVALGIHRRTHSGSSVFTMIEDVPYSVIEGPELEFDPEAIRRDLDERVTFVYRRTDKSIPRLTRNQSCRLQEVV